MRNKLCFLVLLVTSFASINSAAARGLFNYNFFEAGYAKSTFDLPGYSKKPTGSDYGIFGSIAINPFVAIGVSFGKANASFNGSASGIPLSYTSTASFQDLAVTFHSRISGRTELGLDLSRNHANIDPKSETISGSSITVPASTDSSNSFAVRARTAILPGLRVLASVGRTTGGNSPASNDYSIGGEFDLDRVLSLGVAYGMSSSTSGNSTDYGRSIGVSARYHF